MVGVALILHAEEQTNQSVQLTSTDTPPTLANKFLMAVVPTQQPAHESCEVKLELKGHTAQVLTTKKKLLEKLKIGLLLLFLT